MTDHSAMTKQVVVDPLVLFGSDDEGKPNQKNELQFQMIELLHRHSSNLRIHLIVEETVVIELRSLHYTTSHQIHIQT